MLQKITFKSFKLKFFLTLYWSSYRIPSFFLNLAHFHITLDNKRTLARQYDVSRYAEAVVITNNIALEGIPYDKMPTNRKMQKSKHQIVMEKMKINKTNHSEGKKYVAVLLFNFLFPCGRIGLSGSSFQQPAVHIPIPTNTAATNWHPRQSQHISCGLNGLLSLQNELTSFSPQGSVLQVRVEAECGEACSAALAVITKHSCFRPHPGNRWLLHSYLWDSVQGLRRTSAATHCQLWVFFCLFLFCFLFFTVQHKVYKRALNSIADQNIAYIIQAVFQQFKKELSSEKCSQSLLIVKLLQLSQLLIFFTESTCSITRNFWTFCNSMSQKPI